MELQRRCEPLVSPSLAALHEPHVLSTIWAPDKSGKGPTPREVRKVPLDKVRKTRELRVHVWTEDRQVFWNATCSVGPGGVTLKR